VKSLRLRFFFVVWPLVTAALVLFGLVLGRWTRVELGRVSVELDARRGMADQMEGRLVRHIAEAGTADSAALSAILRQTLAAESLRIGVIILSRAGTVLASSISGLAPGAIQVTRDSMVRYSRSIATGTVRQRVEWLGPARVLGPGPDGVERSMAVIPLVMDSARATSSIEGTGRALSRRISVAILVGSLLAGLMTALLSEPLLGRVGTLSRAAHALRAGDFSARAPDTGNDELAELARSFNRLAEGLERSEAQRKRLISDVAHELRHPLTNVLGLLEAARDGLRPVDQPLLGVLHEEASLLGRLVDDLRDLSLADAGELTLSIQSLAAGDAARRAAEAFEWHQGSSTLVLEPSEPDLTVRADDRRLGQILRNLIHNARVHSPAGGQVRLGVTRVNGRVVFEVADQGDGIEPAHLPHVWERFYRADPSRSRNTGGMGLGLSVVSRLVQAQGGEAWAESIPGQGSRFFVALPAAG
jgi:signal transduction histidine kinase